MVSEDLSKSVDAGRRELKKLKRSDYGVTALRRVFFKYPMFMSLSMSIMFCVSKL